MIHHPRSPTPWSALKGGLAGASDAEAQRRLVEFGYRVLISILGIQIFDMIDVVVGNLEKVPLTERCSEIARSVIADYDEMRHDSENEA